MKTLLYLFTQILHIGLETVQVCMFIRAIMSFFPVNEDSPVLNFLSTVTEPFIMPVRMLLSHFGIGDDSPLDIAFLLTVILLSVITTFL